MKKATVRKPISMTPEESYDFLDRTLTGCLATIGPGGYPHQVSMMHSWEPGVIKFTAFRKSQKAVNLARLPRASYLVEKTMPYAEIKGAMFIGDVELVEDYSEIVQIARSVESRFRRLAPQEFAVNPAVDIELTARKRVGVILHVKKVTSWDHSKLGGAY
jgi:nitroimidazol reductase NimA-like FMN-containing flavoprotein (pyridoxamine 5'-phosphate oxidase superfamily)